MLLLLILLVLIISNDDDSVSFCTCVCAWHLNGIMNAQKFMVKYFFFVKWKFSVGIHRLFCIWIDSTKKYWFWIGDKNYHLSLLFEGHYRFSHRMQKCKVHLLRSSPLVFWNHSWRHRLPWDRKRLIISWFFNASKRPVALHVRSNTYL